MKRFALLLLLTGLGFGQNITVTKATNTLLLTNTGKKTAILVIAEGSVPVVNQDGIVTGTKVTDEYIHDHLFKPHGFMPGDSFEFDITGSPANLSAAVTFVQYADGTTWGDSQSQTAQMVLAQRTAKLAYLPTIASATNETDFLAALNTTLPAKSPGISIQKQFQATVSEIGATQALQLVQSSWTSAQSRASLWKF